MCSYQGPFHDYNCDECSPDAWALEHLNRDGDLLVPCSRYGSSTFECSPVALRVAQILAGETGEPMTRDSLDYVMGLVVNDHDDIDYLLSDVR